MIATYLDPKSNEKDKYRFIVGDTDTSEPFLFDEEIEFVLSTYDTHFERLYIIYSNMLSKFMRKGNRKLGPQSENYNTTIDNLTKMVAKYERLMSSSKNAPKVIHNTKPVFTKGMHDNV